jgi:subfamily B ATP-binding cassette protein MsbA
MNYLGDILGFVKPYKKEFIASLVFNILTVFFSLVSISALVPVLNIIFDATDPQAEFVPYEGFGNLKDYVLGNVNYWIVSQLEVMSKKDLLLRVILFTGLLFLLKNLFRYLSRAMLILIQNGVERDLRNALHAKILDLELGFYSRNRKGDLLARITTDLHEIQWAILASIHKMVQDPLMILGTLLFLFLFSMHLTIYVLILLPFAAYLISVVGKKLKAPSQRAKKEIGRIVSLMEEHLGALLIIKSFQAEDRLHKSFQSSNQYYKKNMDHMLLLRNLSSPVSEMLGFMLIAAIIWYGGYLILDENSLSPSVFIAYILLFYQIIPPSKSLSQTLYDVNRAEASSQRVLELLHTENELPMIDDPVAIDGIGEGIRFDGVSFKYGENAVIRDLNLFIPAGKTYAFVGESGSGKTTLLSLLNRLYDVTSGSITIDGVDLRSLDKRALRNLFGYISQDPVLFNDTVRNNLWLASPDATEEEMIDALRAANAWEFVEKMPEKLDTRVGERGGNLSGGQRQRVAIARAILKNPDVMILDEATSALDSESERSVQEALDHLLENRTAIVVAHRLSTVNNADRIIVLQDGQIIEQGSHEELLSIKGVYQNLVHLQNV